MKKIKQLILKTRSYLSLKTFKYPTFFVILLIFFFNVIVLTISASIAIRIDTGYESFFRAFTDSVKWMLTPDSLANIEEPQTLVLAVSVLIVGMVLFTGTIIALTTNLIKEYFENKRSGSGKIYLSDHIVILNWNNKVPELVADLLHIDHFDVTVCILADVDKKLAEKQILNAINSTNHEKQQLKNLKVLVKEGDPLFKGDLDDISIEAAKSIIVMNKDMGETIHLDITKSDLNVIKTILSVGRLEFTKSPPIVCEIKKIETKAKIETMASVVETLTDHVIMPICFDRRLGQVIAQTIIHTFMEDVYLSLFSFEGSEVYFLDHTTFDDCLNYHTDCVPLARKGEGVFVLSETDKTVHKKSNETTSYQTLKIKSYKEATNLNVYVVSKNNKLDFMLQSFYEYEKIYGTEFNATWINDEQLVDMIDDLNHNKEEAKILLLSEEINDKEGLDANVIDNLIYIEGHLKRKDIDIIVEILDPNNQEIIRDFNINNTIISNKIVSLLLSKIALFSNTESFYENLLTLEINDEEEDDQEVFIRQANEILEEEFPITFKSKKELIKSIYHSFDQKIIPFGFVRNDCFNVFSDNLHQENSCNLLETDLLVLMKL